MANDIPEATGRTMPAQSPLAPTTADTIKTASLKAIVTNIGAAQPADSVDDLAAPAAPVSHAQAPAIPIAPPRQRLVTVLDQKVADEEQVLLAVLRLIDRAVTPGTLSPVERAFLAGAKEMFDHLSKECEKMLRRKVSDLVGTRADPDTDPLSTGIDQRTPKKAAPRRPRKKSAETDR